MELFAKFVQNNYFQRKRFFKNVGMVFAGIKALVWLILENFRVSIERWNTKAFQKLNNLVSKKRQLYKNKLAHLQNLQNCDHCTLTKKYLYINSNGNEETIHIKYIEKCNEQKIHTSYGQFSVNIYVHFIKKKKV